MLITGLQIPVFALKTIDVYMDGYYIDRDGNVWSTKGRSGSAPTRLSGSTTPSGRYYTLNKRTHRADDVYRRARAHSTFVAETSPIAALAQAAQSATLPAAVSALPAGRTKNAREAVAAKGYLLATLAPNGKLVFGIEPVFHVSDVTAKEEAVRIAGSSGAEVVMLKVVGKVKVQKAVWE